MDPSVIFDNHNGTQNLVLSVIAVLFVQIFVIVINYYFKNVIRKDAKRDLDIKRAFKALRLISGEKWSEVREEIMRDERID